MQSLHHLSRVSPLVGLLVATSLATGTEASTAFEFEQRQVNPQDFVLVAAPDQHQQNRRLVILEQVRDRRRPCWKEIGHRPTRIDPVMMDFDAAGLCAYRRNASGYSIRVAEQDLDGRYQLEVIEHQGELLLLGKPAQKGEASLLIARSQGIADFAKLELLPGWQLTQRMYRGHPLHHLYLSQARRLTEIEDPLEEKHLSRR